MDIRVTKTKNSIINAFLELRARKEIEKITIKELCEKALVNKSTFYSHFADIYDLSEYLENQIAGNVVAGLEHPEYVFSNSKEFNRELFFAYLSQEHLIRIVFSGSRWNQLLIRIEKSLKEIILSVRPDYENDMAANVVFTYAVYGGFYAFMKCRNFGEKEVIDILAELTGKVNEVL